VDGKLKPRCFSGRAGRTIRVLVFPAGNNFMMGQPGLWNSAARRRRAVLWLLGVLILAVVSVGVAGWVVWPSMQVHAAEQALRRDDPVSARARLDQYLAYWPHDRHALLLAAPAARQAAAYAYA